MRFSYARFVAFHIFLNLKKKLTRQKKEYRRKEKV